MPRPLRPGDALDQIADGIDRVLLRTGPPVVVALDGGSGAGKSTLAAQLVDRFDLAWVHVDDFFAARIPDSDWSRLSVETRARLVFEWDRLKSEAIGSFLAGEPARWRPFDFKSGQRPDGTYAMSEDFVSCEPADVILLDGAYTAGPWLEDVVTYTVLLEVPVAVRHRRLDERSNDPEFLRAWHARWDDVERYYLSAIRPSSAFDLVVQNDLPRETA